MEGKGRKGGREGENRDRQTDRDEREREKGREEFQVANLPISWSKDSIHLAKINLSYAILILF